MRCRGLKKRVSLVSDVRTCGVCKYERVRVDEYPCKLCTRMWEKGVEDFLTVDEVHNTNKNDQGVDLGGFDRLGCCYRQ